MSKYNKKDRYRNPGFMGGLCAVCRKKMRDYMHAEYPSMCSGCRASRLSPVVDTQMPTDVSTARSAGIEQVLRRNLSPSELAEAGRLARAKAIELGLMPKKPIQNLNGKLDPRIQALLGKQENGDAKDN